MRGKEGRGEDTEEGACMLEGEEVVESLLLVFVCRLKAYRKKFSC